MLCVCILIYNELTDTAGCVWKGDPEQLARSYVYATSQKGVVSMTDSVPLCVSVGIIFDNV